MDGFKEKKWFVYLGDHHEGPFSLEEIQLKISMGQLTPTNYVWSDSMTDWKMMSEVEVFESIVHARATPAAPNYHQAAAAMPVHEPTITASNIVIGNLRLQPAETPPTQSNELSISTSQLISGILEDAHEATGSHLAPSLATDSVMSTGEGGNELPYEATYAGGKSSSRIQIQAHESPQSFKRKDILGNTISGESPQYSTHEPKSVLGYIKWAVIIAVLGGLGVAFMGGSFNNLSSTVTPMLMSLTDKVPMLGQWISPIPPLEDVAPEEYDGLKSAASAQLEVGPQIALGLSRNDPFAPVLYVSTNLPDGTHFDIYVEGISDTLLNQLSFFSRGQVIIDKKLGKTATLKGLDGKAFPRGQYMVYLVDPGTSKLPAVTPQFPPVTVPKGQKVVASKSYFLGGARDAIYTSRLKEFHTKLIAKSQAELNECKQLAATLEMQLTMTNSKFAPYKKVRRVTPGMRKNWGAFNAQWSQLLAQINQIFAKLTPDALRNDYFYGTLYQAAQQTSQVVIRLHDLQNSMFTSTVDPRSFEIQLGEATSTAQASVTELKTKIDRIEKQPPNPNGMPSREGI